MTEASWDDYLVDANSTPDEIVQSAQYTADDLVDTAATDPDISDADSVALGNADYQTDLAAGNQSWADWNEATGDAATTDAQSWTDYGNENLAAGNTDIAENAFAQADSSLDAASGAYDTASSYESDTAYNLQAASDSVASTETSWSAESTDTSWSAESTDTSWSAESTDTADTTDYSASTTDYSSDDSSY